MNKKEISGFRNVCRSHLGGWLNAGYGLCMYQNHRRPAEAPVDSRTPGRRHYNLCDKIVRALRVLRGFLIHAFSSCHFVINMVDQGRNDWANEFPFYVPRKAAGAWVCHVAAVGPPPKADRRHHSFGGVKFVIWRQWVILIERSSADESSASGYTATIFCWARYRVIIDEWTIRPRLWL